MVGRFGCHHIGFTVDLASDYPDRKATPTDYPGIKGFVPGENTTRLRCDRMISKTKKPVD